jgi:hypothetical protein
LKQSYATRAIEEANAAILEHVTEISCKRAPKEEATEAIEDHRAQRLDPQRGHRRRSSVGRLERGVLPEVGIAEGPAPHGSSALTGGG